MMYRLSAFDKNGKKWTIGTFTKAQALKKAADALKTYYAIQIVEAKNE